MRKERRGEEREQDHIPSARLYQRLLLFHSTLKIRNTHERQRLMQSV